MKGTSRGGFTLPGEAGYEKLTLELAEKWGADVIRDSDGTVLSQEILDAGYDIYSTICIIRDHNDFARKHPGYQQQTFLMSEPVWSDGHTLEVDVLEGYSREQFSLNRNDDSLALWQVFDRTTGNELPRSSWHFDALKDRVVIIHPRPWHRYTVNFCVWRIWEEISMYNHVTNSWEKEHLMQLDPRHPEVMDYFLQWLDSWCRNHPATNVIRFTSLFYNFVWIWGSNARRRDIYSDWASYDFTVSPQALNDFRQTTGIALTLEDFINKGERHPNHMAWPQNMRAYQDFIMEFVARKAKLLVDKAHEYHKKAYVFYDDSWVGMEPYGPYFHSIGFDGLIKCVFSGFEARLCADVDSVQVHELRLHPYLFPVGLGGAPSFSPGGNPAHEAWTYWARIRRALLRKPVDRLGLGGYLHLTEGFPDFVDAITDMTHEFHQIRSLHASGAPRAVAARVGILTSWGKLRTWTCGGHFHEHPDLDLINILESLAGLPFDVSFISCGELSPEKLQNIDVLVNAGFAGSAWSGGDAWQDEKLVTSLTQWVHGGGVLLGVNAPSATRGGDTALRMAHVLGVDIDDGRRLCHGRWQYEIDAESAALVGNVVLAPGADVYITSPTTRVIAENEGKIVAASHAFGAGHGVYLSSFRTSPEATVFLRRLISHYSKVQDDGMFMTDDPMVECTYFPASGVFALANQGDREKKVCVTTPAGEREATLKPFGFQLLKE